MARYLVNRKTQAKHDRHYSGERCNLDDAAGLTFKGWLETDSIQILAECARTMKRFHDCGWCEKQKRYETGAL